MSEIRIIRTARKPHDCGNYPCTATIQPGQRYLLCSLPPRDPDMYSDRWQQMKVCQPCAEQYGQPIEDRVTRRRSTRTRRTVTPLETTPGRPHCDEPRLTRHVTTVHLPALTR